MTNVGYVSVVDKKRTDKNLTMRSRDRDSIRLLMDTIGHFDAEITEGGGTDYPYRIVLSREELKAILASQVDQLDYYNFKTEATRIRGRKYHDFLMNVWTESLKFERL